MARQNVIVLGASADIGRNVARLFADRGDQVVGTYRSRSVELESELGAYPNISLLKCDVEKKKDVAQFAAEVRRRRFRWTTIFSSIGTSEPIGRFFDLDFDKWEASVHLNMTAQLRVIHALFQLRDTSREANLVLMAGGGTNSPFRCYSAYCVAKIGLIKMCELLDDENEGLNAFIVGPGFVRTRTHYETLRAGKQAEGNLARVKEFLDSGRQGTEYGDIFGAITWGIKAGRQAVGGRNISVVHDEWGTSELEERLKRDTNLYKLRRLGN